MKFCRGSVPLPHARAYEVLSTSGGLQLPWWPVMQSTFRRTDPLVGSHDGLIWNENRWVNDGLLMMISDY